MKTAPNWKSLVKKAEKPLRRDIRRTRRPIFNIVRLVKEPCTEFGCEKGANGHVSDPGAYQLVKIIVRSFSFGLLVIFGVSAVVSGVIERNWLEAAIFGVIAIVVPWVCMFWLSSVIWSAHADELRTKREELVTGLAGLRGALLRASLESTIKETESGLFGEESDFHSWTQQLEARAKEIGSPGEVVTEPQAPESLPPYRVSTEVTHVRVVIEKEDFAKAFDRHRAFRASAQKRLDQLRSQSAALGKSVDDLNRLLAKPNTKRDAADQIAKIEGSIQQGVDAVYAELDELSNETQAAHAKAAQAAAASYYMDAQRAAEPIGEPEEAEMLASADAETRRSVH